MSCCEDCVFLLEIGNWTYLEIPTLEKCVEDYIRLKSPLFTPNKAHLSRKPPSPAPAIHPTMRWSGLILAVLALASNLHPSEALRIVQFPPNPQVGRTVFLHVEGAQFPIQCDWFRGNGVNRNRQILKTEYNQVTARGPAYTGREDLWRGCSLKIQNVQASDSGPYTLSMLELRGSEFITAVGHLQVSS